MKTNKIQYCCDRFSIYHQAHKRTFPNIRIIKYKSKFLINGDNPYRFWITTGYEKFDLDNVMIQIVYCPFCGQDLYKFYKSDEYANEIEGVTFPFVK
ncbi:MAG: hypothetical protein LBQ22_05295 [Bacteroidales bacterium]|jgi:hypothetical protein|nr:hypothetical protein [Bacteroidales bacterium]